MRFFLQLCWLVYVAGDGSEKERFERGGCGFTAEVYFRFWRWAGEIYFSGGYGDGKGNTVWDMEFFIEASLVIYTPT